MAYTVKYKRNVEKQINKLPNKIKQKLFALIADLEDMGPKRHNWLNYSKLSKNKYHCHLSYSWVACWKHEKHTILIEVYYVGSREGAPY
ncbi:Type II toxin-antitoxin system RelE/ParE family toxin [Candidatus Magnetomoraceae bacterium gMMP-15]